MVNVGYLLRLLLLFTAGLAGTACATPDGLAVQGSGPVYSLSGGSTVGPLVIESVELAFPNGFGQITVRQRGKLSARAVIRFSGNGSFRARWRVDERVIEEVNLIVTYGSTMTLSPRDYTVIPTFEPGPHVLDLEVLAPVPGFKVPTITYFVTMDNQ